MRRAWQGVVLSSFAGIYALAFAFAPAPAVAAEAPAVPSVEVTLEGTAPLVPQACKSGQGEAYCWCDVDPTYCGDGPDPCALATTAFGIATINLIFYGGWATPLGWAGWILAFDAVARDCG